MILYSSYIGNNCADKIAAVYYDRSSMVMSTLFSVLYNFNSFGSVTPTLAFGCQQRQLWHAIANFGFHNKKR
jgi:hypothetical protein